MLELEHRFQILDVHARLDPDGEPPGAVPDRLEREMHQAGVVRAVVSPPPRDGGYLRANNAVARLCVDRPFVAFARVSGPRDPRGTPVARLRNLTASREDYHTSPDDVEQYAYDERFHGFVLDPARDGLPDDETLSRLADVSLPVYVYAGADFSPDAVGETLLRRDLPVVLGSFGGYPLDRDLMTDALDLLSAHDDLFVDTSHVRFRDCLERALREHPDRVLFGSGTPDVHPDVAVMELLTLDVPEDAMRRAFTHNPARVVSALSPQRQS
ncbi:MAG: amidohydrolase family protein [Haloplanus sp.]